VQHTKAEAGESTDSSDTDSTGTPRYGYLTEPFDDPPAGCHEPADLYSPVECFYRHRQLRAEELSGEGSVAPPGFGDEDSKLHLLDIPSAKYDINLLPLLYKLVRESASVLQIRLGVREVVKSIRMQQEKQTAGGHIPATTAKIQSASEVCALVIFAEDVQDEPSFVSLHELAALCHANKIQTLMVPISNIRTHIVTTRSRARAHTHTHARTHTYHKHTNSPRYAQNNPPSHTHYTPSTSPTSYRCRAARNSLPHAATSGQSYVLPFSLAKHRTLLDSYAGSNGKYVHCQDCSALAAASCPRMG
jgi:hypothetical protein